MKFNSIGYLLKEGLKNLFNNRLMSLAAIGVLVSCLVLTGSASLLSVNVSEVVRAAEEKNVTTVYCEDNMSKLDANYLVGGELKKIENIESFEFYDKDEAIKAYKDVLGEEVFVNMTGDDNPLPHAFHVTMKDLSKYDDTIKQINLIDGVASVSSRTEVADRLSKLSALITTMSIWIISALALISLFIIANTIRMTMYSHRFEISIQKSVGATNAFVRTPFIFEGVVLGVFSAVLSIVLLFLLSNAVIGTISNVLPLNYTSFDKIALPVSVIFILAGGIVGALGSALSIRRYLKHEGNEILGW